MNPKKICFLLDASNSWIEPYVEKFILKHGLSVEDNLTYDVQETSKFDVCFLLGYTKILQSKELSIDTKYYVIHESDLPKGKGFSPISWQILEEKNEISVCLIEVDEKVDSGNIILKDIFKLDGYELFEEIRQKQAEITFKLISKFMDLYPNLRPVEQKGKSTFYKKRNPADSELDINKTLIQQFNLLRICDNERWPAFFIIDGKKYILKIFEGD